MASEDARLIEGQVLAGRYWLQQHLGRGAMGDVFRAQHTKVRRAFAVKVLHPQLVADPKLCLRFEREAELAGRLSHRNVVSVIDVGETTTSRYIVMDFADGEGLDRILASGALAPQRAIGLLEQICDGLAHAHEHGLVHRDLKPENIIVEISDDAEVPRIVDFGLAILCEGAASAEDRLTTRGLVLGTPHYLAPEAALSPGFDHRADLFALGVIMFEMLTGRLPFDGDGVEVAQANVHAPTPQMVDRAPDVAVDPRLEALTRRLLAKNPDDRPATAREVRATLELIQRDRVRAATRNRLEAPPMREPQRAMTEPPPLCSEAPAVMRPVTMQSEPALPRREQLLRARRRSRRIKAAGLAAVLVGALSIGIAVRGSSTTTVARLAVAQPPITPVYMTATEIHVPAPAPSPTLPVTPVRRVREPVITHAQPPTGPAQLVSPPAPVEITQPAPRELTETAPVDGKLVLELYASLGRELKRIADRRDMSADDLWQRYRRLRIQEMIGSASQRAEAMNVLAAIDEELARRFR